MNQQDFNTPQYWDETYKAEYENKQSRADFPRYAMILGHIKDNSKVLDFGCGPGDFLQWLKAQKPSVECTGVDMSLEAIKIARERCPENKYIARTDINFRNVFDVITMQHVLEHVPNPDFYIEQAYNCLDEQGFLILVLPMYDKPWREHLKIWTLDFLRLFMKQQKKWRWIMIHRPSTAFSHADGQTAEEALVICRKVA